jgi:hypothetical protein
MIWNVSEEQIFFPKLMQILLYNIILLKYATMDPFIPTKF